MAPSAHLELIIATRETGKSNPNSDRVDRIRHPAHNTSGPSLLANCRVQVRREQWRKMPWKIVKQMKPTTQSIVAVSKRCLLVECIFVILKGCQTIFFLVLQSLLIMPFSLQLDSRRWKEQHAPSRCGPGQKEESGRAARRYW
jgi:hypothetical protein